MMKIQIMAKSKKMKSNLKLIPNHKWAKIHLLHSIQYTQHQKVHGKNKILEFNFQLKQNRVSRLIFQIIIIFALIYISKLDKKEGF